MNIEELIDLLSDMAEKDPEIVVLVQCEHTHNVKHPILGIRPRERKGSNVVEYAIIQAKENDDRWLA